MITENKQLPWLSMSGCPAKSKAKASAHPVVCPLGDSVDPSEINVLFPWARKLWERLQPGAVVRALGTRSVLLPRTRQNDSASCIFPGKMWGEELF